MCSEMYLLQNLHIKVSRATPLVGEEIELHNSQAMNVTNDSASQFCTSEVYGKQEVKRHGNNGCDYCRIVVLYVLWLQS